MTQARKRTAYLWAELGQLLGRGQTPKLHAAWAYLNGTPISQPASATQLAPASLAAQRVVAAAEGWVGRQFNPGELAQCAYFVRQVLGEAGVKVGVSQRTIDGYATSNEGAANSFGLDMGILVKATDLLKPGDLVFFRRTYGDFGNDITHVGIFVGNSDMVDRPTAEAPVRRRPVSTFPAAQFVGGLRLAVTA